MILGKFYQTSKIDQQDSQSPVSKFLLETGLEQNNLAFMVWLGVRPLLTSQSCPGWQAILQGYIGAHVELKVEIGHRSPQYANLALLAIKLILLSLCASCLYFLIDHNPRGKGYE